MKKRFSGTAISRYQVFTLADGTFVVQWAEKRVQELLTGQYRDFDYQRDFGHAITNYELAQLRTSGRVEHFNRNYVWLYALPEAGRFGQRRVLGRGDKVRAYYLITSFARHELESVQSLLDALKLIEKYSARTRENFVVLLGKHGMPFRTLEDAEQAQQVILEQAPNVFENLAIAFIETSPNASIAAKSSMDNDNAKLNLDEIIASQTDTTSIAKKLVVLALKQDEERRAFGDLLSTMMLDVKHAYNAPEALQLLEDYPADLFIMDMQLPEARGGWPFVNTIREIGQLRELPIILIIDQQNIGATVSKVEYLIRPVSIARLRHNIWTVMTRNSVNDPSHE